MAEPPNPIILRDRAKETKSNQRGVEKKTEKSTLFWKRIMKAVSREK